jgi:hypothetical protein
VQYLKAAFEQIDQPLRQGKDESTGFDCYAGIRIDVGLVNKQTLNC